VGWFTNPPGQFKRNGRQMKNAIKPSITAVVPVRQGSRRLKNKNIAPFAGTNLLLYKLEQLKRVKSLQRIVVSSDSDLMLNFAKSAGIFTHKRAPEFCDEKSRSFGEVVRHICENTTGDHILWATCTAPLVFPAIYEKAIRRYFQALDEGYDSLMSVQVFRRYLWDKNGPLNYELGLKHVPSQELPPLYFVTDGILIAPREKMIEWSYFHGPNPYRFELEKRNCVDIDDGLDLGCARAWLDMDESVSQVDPFQVPNTPSECDEEFPATQTASTGEFASK
jgi:CMP-N-acetylneuraminic acid synthetase